jgi:hypothetical protein
MNKILTIKQPWSTAILELGKDVDNRTWETPYRGRIYIHCSKTFAHEAIPFLIKFFNSSENAIKEFLLTCETYPNRGNIIGHVDLVDIVKNSPSDWAIANQFHWILKKPVILPQPIPARGSLGLWNLNE